MVTSASVIMATCIFYNRCHAAMKCCYKRSIATLYGNPATTLLVTHFHLTLSFYSTRVKV